MELTHVMARIGPTVPECKWTAKWTLTFLGPTMDQGPDIYRVAEETVGQLGSDAYSYLCERAEMAKLSGDRDSAITWWDIALAAIEILSVPPPESGKRRL